MQEYTLKELLNRKKISQKTFTKTTIVKEYIERKYNLKKLKNMEWNGIIEKIDNLNLSESQKEKVKKNIFEKEVEKYRKNREKLSARDYQSISIIGRGAFGEVHVCKEIKTNKIVAIKKIKKEVIENKNQVIHIRNEQLILSKVKSKWIIDLKASFQEGDYLFLVMEYSPGGDLMSLLIKKDILTEEEAKFYTAELILAIESIHKLDCIHRDIKPDNILIDKTGHIKLSDFGLAKVPDTIYEKLQDNNYNDDKKSHQKNFSCVGTAYYVAPEVLNKKGYGQEVDWWSVGVIFFEMLVGYAPFCSKDTSEVCYKILNWEKYLKIPHKIKMSKEAEDLIYKMINNKNMRLGKNGSDEIKKHPFFKGVDWDNIREQKAPFIPELSSDYDTRYFEIFQEQEPFYPPLIKHPRRKDIQFIGFTYREDEDSNPTLNDEYNNAIQIVDDIKNIEDSDDDNDNNNNNVNNKEILVKKNSNGPLKRIKIENLKNYSGNNLKNSRNNSPILLLNKTSNPKGKRLSPSPKRINIENKLKKNISAGKMLSKTSSSQDKKKSKIK
jgi:serine/threonine kinase 38